jgi:BolA family transcriptional regulator, general stress-responsive regulator
MNIDRMNWLKTKLQDGLKPTMLNIIDDSAKHAGHEGAKAGGSHFTVEIASPLFQDKQLITCHRMIYDLVTEAIPHEIHALKIKVKK